jgi:protoheme IX farnesyltransferase
MKLRVVELLLITTVPTMVLAEQGWPSWGLVAITLIGGTLAAGGANAINMVIDRDIDALMDRTKTRPLVTGLIQPRDAMIFALALEAVAFAIFWPEPICLQPVWRYRRPCFTFSSIRYGSSARVAKTS